MLGPVEVLDGDLPVPIGGPKQRALLAVLLLSANRVVSRTELVEALWGGSPPPTADTAVHVYVSRLRKALPAGRLETRPPGYLLRVEPEELDLDRFERLAQEGRPHEALTLWRGPALAGVELPREAHRLEELRDAVLEERIQADLADGLHGELVSELEELVARDPLRERLRGQLMIALYRSGRQAEALEQYREIHRALGDELGIEPDPALRRLHTAMLRQAGELEPAAPARAAVLFAVLRPPADEEPAAVRDLLEQAFEAASSELGAAGATVERGLAGALLARFEEDPARALAAAVALRDRLSGGPVRARIGLETGDVLAGETLTGPPVAAASRLAGAARPGEILVGADAATGLDRSLLRRRGDAFVLVE